MPLDLLDLTQKQQSVATKALQPNSNFSAVRWIPQRNDDDRLAGLALYSRCGDRPYKALNPEVFCARVHLGPVGKRID